jgi:hypothetical protein
MVCTFPLGFSSSIFEQQKWSFWGWSLAGAELGVITAMDAVTPPPLSRFNSPKHECLHLTKQRISFNFGTWVHKRDHILLSSLFLGDAD